MPPEKDKDTRKKQQPAQPAEAGAGESRLLDERQFVVLLDLLPGVSIQGYGTDGVIRYWNKASEDVYGYTRVEAIGKRLCDLIIPQEQQDEFAGYLSEMAHAKPQAAPSPPRELNMRHKDGGPVPVYSIRAVAHFEEQTPLLFSIDMDLSERRLAEQALKLANEQLELRVNERTEELSRLNRDLERQIEERMQSERALKESESRYQKMLEATTNYRYSVFVVDGRPVSSEHGPGCQQLTGYTSQDFFANPDLWMNAVHPDDRKQVENTVQRMIQGADVPPLEHRIGRKDGAERWIRCILVPHRDANGRLFRYDCLVEDITVRKSAEQALKDSEERFRTVADYTYDWELWYDERRRLVYCSPSCERITGYTRDEITSGTITPITCAAQDNRDKARAIMDRAMRGETFGDAKFAITHKDGAIKWVAMAAAPVFDENGRFRGCRNSIRNITEQHFMESRMRNLQKMEAISALAGGIAHDFTNWLVLIMGRASALAESLIPESKLHDDAVQILTTARRANELTKRLLGVARASDFSTDPPPERVWPGAAVRDTAALVRESFAQKNITFNLVDLENMPAIMFNAARLIDILMNLFLNAADAMAGGGEITVRTTVESIADAATRNADAENGVYVALHVCDTGSGMQPDVLARAFEPFFTTKEVGSGTGLGLPMVHTAIQNYGGWVDIQSTAGVGTVFKLYLPMAPAAETSESEPAKKEPGRKLGTILLIDDDDDLLGIIAEVLRESGYEVRTATTGKDGLALYREAQAEIDLCMVDVIMPEQDGRWAIGQFLKFDSDAKLILMSGFSRDYVRSLIPRGAWGFIQKPVEREHLLAAIERLLQEPPTGG